MSWEYVFHTASYKPFNKGLIEGRVRLRLLPYTLKDVAKDGSCFYTGAGGEPIFESFIGLTAGIPVSRILHCAAPRRETDGTILDSSESRQARVCRTS